MTESVQIALIAGLGVAIPSILTSILTARGQSKKLDEAKQIAHSNAAVAETAATRAAQASDKAAEVAEVVRKAVDGRLTAAMEARARAEKRIVDLLLEIKAGNGNPQARPEGTE